MMNCKPGQHSMENGVCQLCRTRVTRGPATLALVAGKRRVYTSLFAAHRDASPNIRTIVEMAATPSKLEALRALARTDLGPADAYVVEYHLGTLEKALSSLGLLPTT